MRPDRILLVSSWLIAASLLMLPACSPGDVWATADPATDSRGSLFLTGSINPESLKRLRSSLSPQMTRLVVNSAGGRVPEAIQLGALVREHDLEVVVDGICLSACAHFVFLPAKRKRLEPNSLVAFHQTATAISDVLIASGRRDLAAVYLPFAGQEQEFYRQAGLSRRALVDPFLTILPVCYWEYKDRPAGSEYRTATMTQFTFYVPSLSELHALGAGAIGGRWPTSPADVGRAVSRYPRKLNATFKIKLTTGGTDNEQEARPIPTCPADPGHRVPARSR
jgi:hypothetical protein